MNQVSQPISQHQLQELGNVVPHLPHRTSEVTWASTASGAVAQLLSLISVSPTLTALPTVSVTPPPSSALRKTPRSDAMAKRVANRTAISPLLSTQLTGWKAGRLELLASSSPPSCLPNGADTTPRFVVLSDHALHLLWPVLRAGAFEELGTPG